MRKPIIAGNWKMNNDIFETEKLMNTLLPLVAGAEAEVDGFLSHLSGSAKSGRNG